MKKSIILHLSVLIGALIPVPFGNVILHYAYWRIQKNESTEEFSIQACNVLNFMLVFNAIFYLSMIILWHFFIADFKGGTRPDYPLMILPVSLFCFFCLLYPIVTALSIHKKGDRKVYYPKTIRIFK